MFHQANVISSVSSGGEWSLATYWAKTLAKELGNYIDKFPVTTYKLDEYVDTLAIAFTSSPLHLHYFLVPFCSLFRSWTRTKFPHIIDTILINHAACQQSRQVLPRTYGS